METQEATFAPTPQTEGEAEQNTATQPTEPISQETAQPEQSGTPTVEGEKQPPASEPASRPRASDYYEVRKLKKELKALKELVSSTKKEPTAESPKKKSEFDPGTFKKKFWETPEESILAIRQELLEQLEDRMSQLREKELPDFLNKTERERAIEKEMQAALELIVPKSNPDDKASLKERAERDADRIEAIQEIIEEYGLEELSKTNPLKAAKAAVKIYESQVQTKKGERSPNAVSKSQMASTATGSPIGGGKKTRSVGEVTAELEKLDRELTEDSGKRYDDAFQSRRQAVISELVALTKGN